MGDMTNSLLNDGTLNQFDPSTTTQGLFVNLVTAQIGLGNTVGNAVSKNIGHEFWKNVTKQVIGQNIDGLISSISQRTWQTESLIEGLKMGWNDYTKEGGWAKSTASGFGQGVWTPKTFGQLQEMGTWEAMKAYHAKIKTWKVFEYTFQPDTWMESFYHSQIKFNTQINLNLYKPTRQFFNYSMPKWYYPQLYPNYY
jgi:hypothetical protein